MIFLIFLLQIISLFWSYRITRMFFSFLVLANVIIFLNQIGTIYETVNFYDSYNPSVYLLLTSFSLNIGGYLAKTGVKKRKLFGFRRYFLKQKNPEFEKVTHRRFPKHSHFIIANFLFFICLCITFYNYIQHGIPIFNSNIETFRVEYSVLPFYRLSKIFMPFLSIVILSYTFSKNERKYYKMAAIVLVSTILVLFSLGFKGSVFWYVILLLMTVSIYKKGKSVFFYFFPLVLIAISMFSVSTKLIYKFDNFYPAVKKVFERFTVSNASGYCILVNEFIPSGARNDGKEVLNAYLWKWKFGTDSKRSELNFQFTLTLTGTLLFFSGPLGVLLFSALFGFIFHYLNLLCFKFREEPLVFSFLIYLLFMFLGVINRGLGRHFYVYMMSSLLLIFFLHLFMYIIIEKKPTIRF